VIEPNRVQSEAEVEEAKEMPLNNPQEMTVWMSTGFGSKKCSRCATYSVKKVTITCQLVSVVAA
jgi:hypothetical protein